MSILSRFKGWNNGAIAVSYRQIAHDHAKKNQAWIAPAIVELIEHGLIVIETEAAKLQRHAREYRITFVSTGEHARRRPATNEYLLWQP